MTQRNALILSATITAFVLVLVGGVAARVAQPFASAPPATVVPIAVVAPSVSDDSRAQSILEQRQAAYEQAIQQANDQLKQAYAKQQALANQLAQAKQAPPTQAAPAYAISRDTATVLALNAAQGASLVGIDLVKFEGIVAYEVTMDRGKVYIDANTGQVLFNNAVSFGVAPAPSQPQAQAPAPSGPTGGDDHHEEGEGGGDD